MSKRKEPNFSKAEWKHEAECEKALADAFRDQCASTTSALNRCLAERSNLTLALQDTQRELNQAKREGGAAVQRAIEAETQCKYLDDRLSERMNDLRAAHAAHDGANNAILHLARGLVLGAK